MAIAIGISNNPTQKNRLILFDTNSQEKITPIMSESRRYNDVERISLNVSCVFSAAFTLKSKDISIIAAMAKRILTFLSFVMNKKTAITMGNKK
ncbi:hypothetical protein TUM17560_02340 [Serratia marcescens]|nr:hypothetical protein TUM17560_02340 [Serratia marcescens]